MTAPAMSKYRGKLSRLAGTAPPKSPPPGYQVNLTKAGDRYEYFAVWDETMEVWEMYLDDPGVAYIGCADYLKDAVVICDDHEEENKP